MIEIVENTHHVFPDLPLTFSACFVRPIVKTETHYNLHWKMQQILTFKELE